MVANGVAGYRHDLVSSLFPQTFWDDAVIHLDNKFDPVWADIFIADYFHQSEGFDTIIVIGPDGRARFAEEDDRPVAPGRLAQFLVAASPLISEIRAGEAKRGPLPQVIPDRIRLTPVLAQSIESVEVRCNSLPDRSSSRTAVHGSAAIGRRSCWWQNESMR